MPLGIPGPGRPVKVGPNLARSIRERLRSGEAVGEVAKSLGVSRMTISRVRRAGVEAEDLASRNEELDRRLEGLEAAPMADRTSLLLRFVLEG